MKLFSTKVQLTNEQVFLQKLSSIRNTITSMLEVDPTPSFAINEFNRSFYSLMRNEGIDASIMRLITSHKSILVVDICKSYITYILHDDAYLFDVKPGVIDLSLVQKNKLFLYKNVIDYLDELIAFFEKNFTIIAIESELYGLSQALKDLKTKAKCYFLEAFSQWGREYETILTSGNYLLELHLPLRMDRIITYAKIYPEFNNVQNGFPRTYYVTILLFFLRLLAREGSGKWLPHLSKAKTAFTYLDIPLKDILTTPEDLSLVTKLFDLESA